MRKALYILGELTDLDIEWLIEHGRREPVARGAVLIRQGEALTSLYVVLRGLFTVTDARLSGREMARLGAGEILGEMSLLEARPPSATVTAAEAGLVLAIARGELDAHLKSNTAFAARFYRALAVFLSDRVRATVRTLGYGVPAASAVNEAATQDDELDLNVLDKIHLAGQRFDDILKRLAG